MKKLNSFICRIYKMINTFETLFGESEVYKTILSSVNILTKGVKTLKDTFISHVKTEDDKAYYDSRNDNNLDGSKKLYLFIDDINNIVQYLRHIINQNQFSATNVIDM